MRNLLVPVDLSEISNTVVAHAACMAKSVYSKVWLLHVALPAHESIPFNVDRNMMHREVAKELNAQRHRLHELAEQLRQKEICVHPYHIPGNISKTILAEAKRIDADLIIIGSHRHCNSYRAVFGGVGQRVMRLAACPVTLVCRRDTKPYLNWKQTIFRRERRIRM